MVMIINLINHDWTAAIQDLVLSGFQAGFLPTAWTGRSGMFMKFIT